MHEPLVLHRLDSGPFIILHIIHFGTGHYISVVAATDDYTESNGITFDNLEIMLMHVYISQFQESATEAK